MSRAQRPDFNDAGYGQMGCPIMLVSVVLGIPLAVFVAWWLEIPPPRSGPVDLDAGDLLGVAVAALSGALALTLAAEWVIQKFPVLWARSDVILLAIWLVAPAGLVLAVLLTETGRVLLTPLLVLTGVMVIWMIVDAARARRPG